MSSKDIQQVLEQVEKAEGPDRTIDDSIWINILEKPEQPEVCEECGMRKMTFIPAYTASLDAALTGTASKEGGGKAVAKTLTCIVCSGVMDNLDERGNQPDGGLAFSSSGHYGSTVFDPMDGSFLELNICDACLVNNADIILHGQPSETPRAKYKRWKP